MIVKTKNEITLVIENEEETKYFKEIFLDCNQSQKYENIRIKFKKNPKLLCNIQSVIENAKIEKGIFIEMKIKEENDLLNVFSSISYQLVRTCHFCFYFDTFYLPPEKIKELLFDITFEKSYMNIKKISLKLNKNINLDQLNDFFNNAPCNFIKVIPHDESDASAITSYLESFPKDHYELLTK